MASRTSRFRLVEPALVEQRRAQRHFVTVTRATVRPFGEEPEPAVLHDVSPFGCRLAAATGHAAGDRLWLRLGGGMPVAATVVWCDEDTIGCRFDVTLDQASVRTLTLGR